jgi:choline transport protein
LSGILVAGRTTWAFARDNGMPFSKYFSVIDERTQMPLRATLLSMFLSICYGAIYIGSPVAFTSIVGPSIVMLFSTYGQ